MIARLIALVFKLVFGFVALSLLMVVIYRFVPPPTTITMLSDANGATRDWTPLDRIELSGDVLRASARFEPNTRLALARSTLEAKAVTLHGDAGWTAGIDHAIVATRPAATGTRFAHDLSIEAGGLSLPDLIAANVTGVFSASTARGP